MIQKESQQQLIQKLSVEFDLAFSSFLSFPGSSTCKESACNIGDASSIPGSGRFPGEGIGCLLQYSWVSLVAQLVKNPPTVWETWVNLGAIPGLGRPPGERNGYPLQYSGLENSMHCIVHGVTKSRTRLSDFHFHLFNNWLAKL